MSTIESERFWTIKEIAAKFGKSPNTVLSLIRSGNLKASNLGASARPRWIVSESDLKELLSRRQIPKTTKKANG